jgi:hypothetical protein
LLTDTQFQVSLPLSGIDRLQDWLYQLVPYDSARGEEGVTTQCALLIGLLVLIGFSSWKGMENILAGFNRWTWVSIGLVIITLLIAALGMVPQPGELNLGFTGRFFGVVLAISALAILAWKGLTRDELRSWLWESWRFVKQIFPLLVIGVFSVGVIRVLVRPEWIQTLAGRNTVLGNLAGVIFGVFMYFPTLVEVPIAKMFLSLGMHRGPLLAYLMADPELSLQSILIVSTIIGRVKSWTYAAWVALFSVLAGLIYGAWVDGTGLGLVLLYLGAFLAVLIVALVLVNKRNLHKVMTTVDGERWTEDRTHQPPSSVVRP